MSIEDKLNLPPLILATIAKSANTVPQTTQPKQVQIYQENESEQIEDDFRTARSQTLGAISKASEATEYIFEIAKTKEGAKEFEALNGILKTVGELSKNLMSLHHDKKRLANKVPEGAPGSTQTFINNAVFTGSSKDLNNLIQQMKSQPPSANTTGT